MGTRGASPPLAGESKIPMIAHIESRGGASTLISYAAALASAEGAGARHAVGSERVPLPSAVGRVAAAEVRSPEAHPPFDNSGVDGFVLRAADAEGVSPERPLILAVGGSLAAGDAAAGVRGRVALEIMTGAKLPPGFDAVVRVEDVVVRREGAGLPVEVTLRKPVSRGDDVRPRGEDFGEGDLIVAENAVLRVEHVMALAALGIVDVTVRRRPRVAVIATGKELVPPTMRALPPAAVRNSTSPYLAAILPGFGADAISFSATGDDPAALRAALVAAREGGADLVLTTGAVSMGKHDFVPVVLRELGAEVLFHKVAVRPGKPVLLAELPGGPAFLGLPGNPVASAVSLRFLGVPLLRAMLGLAPEAARHARLLRDTPKADGMRCFFKGEVAVGPGGASVEVLDGQGSAILSSLIAANAWAVLPEAGRVTPAGTDVEVHTLTGVEAWPQRGAP